MKVLMTEHFLPESIYTLELGRELKQYCDLSVFCKKTSPGEEPGIRWIRDFYPGGSNKVQAVVDYGMSLLCLGRQIRKGQYDIVHVQGFKSAPEEMKLYLGTRKYYKKLVHTVHNLLPHEVAEGDKKRYSDFYHACDLLITHNEACKKRLVEDFSLPDEKIWVISHGAYQTHLKDVQTRREDSRTRFLQFGFIRRYKGVDILLKAVSLLPDDIRDRIHVTIAGKQHPKLDGTDYGKMIRELGISECVEFRPERIPEEEMNRLFGDADVAVFPYREIYASGALLMAYTYEKPVIASNIPVFVEETSEGSTGLLFESEDPSELAKAMMMACSWSREQKDAYKTKIRTLTEKKYNWSISAAKTAEAYEQVLSGLRRSEK